MGALLVEELADSCLVLGACKPGAENDRGRFGCCGWTVCDDAFSFPGEFGDELNSWSSNSNRSDEACLDRVDGGDGDRSGASHRDDDADIGPDDLFGIDSGALGPDEKFDETVRGGMPIGALGPIPKFDGPVGPGGMPIGAVGPVQKFDTPERPCGMPIGAVGPGELYVALLRCGIAIGALDEDELELCWRPCWLFVG